MASPPAWGCIESLARSGAARREAPLAEVEDEVHRAVFSKGTARVCRRLRPSTTFVKSGASCV